MVKRITLLAFLIPTLILADSNDDLLSGIDRADIRSVKQALAAGADVNTINDDGRTALMLAASEKKTEIIKILLAANANVKAIHGPGDAEGMTALHYAAGNNCSMACLNILVAAGADVNAKAADGTTPLHFATITCNAASVQFLLKASVAVGNTLINAASCTEPAISKIVKMALAAKADINKANSRGETALTEAATFSPPAVVKLLLAAGAEVNAITQKGATPLMGAIGNGHVLNVKLLIAAGADVNYSNANGETALSILRGSRYKESTKNEILKMLVAAGAN